MNRVGYRLCILLLICAVTLGSVVTTPVLVAMADGVVQETLLATWGTEKLGSQTGELYGRILGKKALSEANGGTANFFAHNMNLLESPAGTLQVEAVLSCENTMDIEADTALFTMEICDKNNELRTTALLTVTRADYEAQEAASLGGAVFTLPFEVVGSGRYEFRIFTYAVCDVLLESARYIGKEDAVLVAWSGEDFASINGQDSFLERSDTDHIGMVSYYDSEEEKGVSKGFLIYGSYFDLPQGNYAYEYRYRCLGNVADYQLAKVDVSLLNENQQETILADNTIDYATHWTVASKDDEGFAVFRQYFSVGEAQAGQQAEGRMLVYNSSDFLINEVRLIEVKDEGYVLMEDPPWGDVDGSGQIDALDALLTLKYFISLVTLTNDQQVAANVDGQEGVTAGDALIILKYSVGMIDSFPVQNMEEGVIKTVVPWANNNQVYARTVAATDLEGARTTFQVAAQYNESMDIPADSVMCYATTIASVDPLFQSWISSGYTGRIDCMIACNRDNFEFFKYATRESEYYVQTRSDGTPILHSGTTHYMVPTMEYVEYKWQLIEAVMKHNPSFIAVEEPEMFHDSGYSQGFKDEWKVYYNEEWQDPEGSAEAKLKSAQLKTHLFERILIILSERLNESYPDTKMYIALHSTVSYNTARITTGFNHYTEIPGIAGVIGQTWSDTARGPMAYGGTMVHRVFEESFIEYSSYAHSINSNQDFFALADPKADDPKFTWPQYETWWKQTLVSSLLQQNIHRFEIFPWPDRSFSAAPSQYKTTQLAVFNALSEIGGLQSTLYAGTPGIFYTLSDTVSWQYGNGYMPTYDTNNSIFGMTLPLVEKGIPIQSKSLEKIKSADDLRDVKLLIVSYDCMKPLSESVNIGIAQWVKEGGTVLYIGGHDAFVDVSSQWWNMQGETPLTNLMAHMGLNDIAVEEFYDKTGQILSWTGDKSFQNAIDDAFVPSEYIRFSNLFSGTGYTPIIQADGEDIGIDAAVGKGRFLALSLPSSFMAAVPKSPDIMRDMVRYALQYTDRDYVESGLMLIKRGNYIAAETLAYSETLRGKFIDLFDAELPIITRKNMTGGDSALLYDISDIADTDTPVFGYTGGVLQSDVIQTENTTAFTVKGTGKAVFATRILGGAKYPQKVSVTRDGVEQDCIVRWDNETRSLLLYISDQLQSVDVTVTWGDTYRPDDPAHEYESFLVITNNEDLDKDYLVRTNAGANDSIRFADRDTEIVYRFDFKDYIDFQVHMQVFQNYLIQVSDHDGNYIDAYDYSKIHPNHNTAGNNHTIVTLDPAEFGYTDTMYVRIANTDVTKGWGGSIRYLILSYKR